MDELLAKAGSQAVTFAIRSGISIASGFAIKTVTKFLDKIPEDERVGLERTKKRLQTRIDIVSTAIDLIKLVAARGNTSLESTLRLTKDLKDEIDDFDETVAKISNGVSTSTNQTNRKSAVKDVETYMKDLLERIEEAIPLISLSLTTSGANLSGSLSSQVSPGRLLQASNFVNNSNDKFLKLQGSKKIQVGPTFDLIFYSIFYNPKRVLSGGSGITWKEDFARCNAKIWRNISKANIYSYTLEITENHDDGRYHDEEEVPKSLEYDVSSITRLFFSASGKLLKLEERNSPVLVLKINKEFESDATIEVDTSIEENNNTLIEWIAFGEKSDESSDSESEESEDESKKEDAFLNANDDDEAPVNKERTSLSLLEYLLRLCTLQSNDQISILKINDERLSLYLNDENKSQSEKMNENTKATPTKNRTKYLVTEQHNKANKLSEKLKGLELSDEEKPGKDLGKVLETPTKLSPVPGDTKSAQVLTPWERDKRRTKLNQNVNSTPSINHE